MSDLDGCEPTALETTDQEQHASPRYASRGLELPVLLIEYDTQRLNTLQRALRNRGVSVRAVKLIAEISRWPLGHVVVTDQHRFTPWWKEVGAAHVIVLADTLEDGRMAVLRGASAWLPRDCSPDALLAAMHRLGTRAADSNPARV